LELLRTPPSTELQVGKWVQVLKGTYKGDVGYVLSTASWGLELLLVPRLSLPDQLGSKRKRSPSMALFDDEIREWNRKVDEPARITENFRSFGGHRFQHGLIVRRYSLASVSTKVSSIPLKAFSLFRFSGHPELIASESTYPRPSEWLFAESDEVFIVDNPINPTSFKAGVISTLRNNSVELDTKDSGTVSIPWLKICKILRGGDFVEVTGGIHQGSTGWVVEVNMNNLVANIISIRDEETQMFDCSKVCPTLNEYSCTHIPLRHLKSTSIY
jgi:ribosomal protein L24